MKRKTFMAAGLCALLWACGGAWAVGYEAGSADALDNSVASVPGNEQIIPSFEAVNADVRAVFEGLSRYSGTDIVLSEKVKGTVTIRLTNKSWKDVLSIVCRILNLSATREDSYVFVMTDEEFKEQQISGKESVQRSEEIDPLEREIIPLSNISAAEMRQALETLLSQRGKITVVEHNNTLIVYDTRKSINQIRTMVRDLDVETRQISISCKIIEVSSGEAQNLGIHWGFFDPDVGVKLGHLPPTDFVAGALEKVSYGILSPERFSLAMEYLFEDNRGEVVAQPSITTLDNKEARIFMGQQVPIKYLDEARNTLIKMVDAGTELNVTPHVTGEGRIMLQLNPKKKSYELTESGDPLINEQSAQTNVVVNDGETVVIAGLTSNEKRNTEGGIPVLKDIPIVGNLFKRSQKRADKKDLIIFVTPNIISKKIDTVRSEGAVHAE